MHKIIAFALCAAALAGCDSPSRNAVAATRSTSSSVSVPNKGIIPGTPAGDLGDWVKDIRRGIAKLPKVASTDVPAAQKAAIDLYVTRQEYDEMYYGVEGRIKPSEELAQAIETAETRFHELMKILGTKAPSQESIRDAVDALDAQQARVLKLWKKTGAHLDRSGN